MTGNEERRRAREAESGAGLEERPAPEVPSTPATTRAGYRAMQAVRHSLRVPRVPRNFRKDIQGMRAVAVLGVVLWHAGLTWLPGGFTGVDVFFVVSGFLMGSLLLEEARERGRIDLGRFYARRARRLLPAALTALAGTALLTVAFLPRARWAEIGGDLVASAAYVVNWRLASRSVDYLSVESAPSPVQHYWSLAVEEQFYVVWPILLLLLLLLARGRARVFHGWAWGTTIALLAGSLALSWWWTGQDAAAYFVTPTRIFELMLGVVVALGMRLWPRIPTVLGAALGWIGLAMILAALVVIDASDPFPGTWALLPTVGTALVLIAGPAGGRFGPVAVLRHTVLQWLGRISYSLYLWHWPFVAVATELVGVGRGGPAALPAHWGLLAVAVSVVPAWLSFRYVEEPVRRHGSALRRQFPEPVVTWRTLRLGLNCTLAGVMLGVLLLAVAPPATTRQQAQWQTPDVVRELRAPVGAGTLGEGNESGAGAGDPDDAAATTDAGDPDDAAATTAPDAPADPGALAATGYRTSLALGEPLPPARIPETLGELAVPLDLVPEDQPMLEPAGCFVGLTGRAVGTCRGGDASGSPTVVLIGDSHASMWMSALDPIGRDRGWRVMSMAKSSCPPGLDLAVERSGDGGTYQQCSAWQEHLTERLEQVRPDVVLLSSASYGATGSVAVAEGLQRRVEQIEDFGGVPVLIRDVPRAPFDVPGCLSEHPDDVPACAFDRNDGLDAGGTGHVLLTQRRPDLPVIDLTDAICPARTCSPVVGGVVVWRDSNHLSATYVTSLREVLETEILAVLERDAILGSGGRALDVGAELGTE